MPASVVTVKGNEPRPLLLVIPKGWAASWRPQPALFESFLNQYEGHSLVLAFSLLILKVP